MDEGRSATRSGRWGRRGVEPAAGRSRPGRARDDRAQVSALLGGAPEAPCRPRRSRAEGRPSRRRRAAPAALLAGPHDPERPSGPGRQGQHRRQHLLRAPRRVRRRGAARPRAGGRRPEPGERPGGARRALGRLAPQAGRPLARWPPVHRRRRGVHVGVLDRGRRGGRTVPGPRASREAQRSRGPRRVPGADRVLGGGLLRGLRADPAPARVRPVPRPGPGGARQPSARRYRTVPVRRVPAGRRGSAPS